MRSVDVLVIGAGLTGCALAVGLKQAGLRVLLVEKERAPGEHFRGEYLQPAAVAGLVALGFGRVVEGPASCRIDELVFMDVAAWPDRLAGRTQIRYPDGQAARSLSHKALIAGMREEARRQLGEDLREGSTARPLGDLDENTHLPPFFIDSPLGAEAVQADWVVGCDGRGSLTRRWMSGRSWSARSAPALGAEVDLLVGGELEGPPARPGRVDVIRCAGEGTLWLFPLGPSRQRVYLNLPLKQAPKGMGALEAALTARLERVAMLMGPMALRPGSTKAAPAGTAWLGPAARGRALLAGDAAAVCTPLSGQGMSCAMVHVSSLLQQLSQTGAQPAVLAAAHEAAVATRFQQVQLLNLGLVHQFFSRSAPIRALSPGLLRRWNADPGLRARVGQWFGGQGGPPLGRREFARLMGLGPRPRSWA